MAKRFPAPPRPYRGVSTQELRSQVALELLLNGYALVGALFVFRALFKALEVSSQRWVGNLVYGTTGIVADRLLRIPAADSRLIGDLNLIDLTLVSLVVLFPLGLLMFGSRTDTDR